MTNIILASGTLSDTGTLTGSSTAASLGIDNLQTQAIAQPARFTSPSGYVQIDLGEISDADFVALMGMNAKSGTCRVRTSTSALDITTSPDYDSGVIDLVVGETLNRNSFYHLAPPGLSARHWRMDFSADNVSYLDIGRLYVCKAFSPEVNADYGEAQGFSDPSEKRYTKSGRLESNKKPKRRTQEFTLSFGSKEEMYGQGFDIDNALGTTGDMLFIADISDTTYLQKRSIYGAMSDIGSVQNSHFQLYEKTYRIEEIIA